MAAPHVDESPNVSRPLVFWGVIGILIALCVGLMVALMWSHPGARGRVREVWIRWTTVQEVREGDPRQSLNLPIQSPTPQPLPYQPSSPIDIPKPNPSLQSFDTFGERLPIRANNLDRFRMQADKQYGVMGRQGYI
jgi:hypothetical protein